MNKELSFMDDGWDDYIYWQTANKKVLKKINDLLKDITRNPFSGIGKPEPLKHEKRGFWSRLINDEHRIVYRVEGNKTVIYSCKGHYDD